VTEDGRQMVVNRKVGMICTCYELNKSALLTVCVAMNYHSVLKDLLQDCCFIPTHAHIYTLKHKFTLTFKTLKSTLKHFSAVATTCFGPYVRPSSGVS
jgi:hypothetical protein